MLIKKYGFMGFMVENGFFKDYWWKIEIYL